MTNNKNRKERTSRGEFVVLGGLVAVTLLSGATLMATRVSAEESTSETVSVTVSSSCTITGTNTDHTTTAVNGNITPDIGLSTINARCNDANGFAIYAIGYTGDTDGNNKLVNSTLGPSADIATGTNTTGNSSWSMKLATTTSPEPTYPVTITTGYDDYHAVPDDYTLVVKRTAPTDVGTNATGAIFTTTYRAYISDTQPAGTYTGKVKYVLVHPNEADAPEIPPKPQPSTAGYITYYANAKNTEGIMGNQSASNGASVTLLPSNFSRAGYGFAGWSDAYDYATNASAHFYGPMETITAPSDVSTKGLSLYAVWVKSEGSLQDASKVASVCSSLTQAQIDGTAGYASISALTDSRDNQTYAIAKLADGKCWMIENLRLDNSATLTLANTNNPLNDGINVTLKHNYTDANTSTTLSPTSSVAYNADTAPDGWCDTNSADCDDQSRLNTDNTASRATGNPNVNTGSMYSYGNYYNWYSATAGNGTYGFGTNNNSVGGDLCPSGWRLPKGGQTTVNTTAEFYLLGKALMGQEPDQNASGGYGYYGNNVTNTAGDTATKAFRRYPNNYLYSGYVVGGSLNYRGSNGYYWSSTAGNFNGAYYLYLDSSYVYPGTYSYYKYGGRTVRCVAGS